MLGTYVVHVVVHGEWVMLWIRSYNFITVGHDRYGAEGVSSVCSMLGYELC